VSGKHLVRPWLGARGQAVTYELANSLGLKVPVGVLINDIYPHGPADRAGVRVGDVIRDVDGHEVDDPEGLRFRIATRRLGESIRLDVIRDGRTLTLTFPIEQPPEQPPRDATEISSASPLQGATIANLSPALDDELGLDLMTRGVVVTKVRRGSAAQRYGFQPGDIIQGLDGTKVGSVAQFQRGLGGANGWRMTIRRGDQTLAFSVGR
jgi:serine protease Do